MFEMMRGLGFKADVSNFTSTFNTASNLIGLVILVGIACGVLVILFYLSSSYSRFKRFHKLVYVFKLFYKSLSFFAFGCLTIGVVGGPVILGYYCFVYASDNVESLFPVLRWMGIIVGIYLLVSLLGWAAKKHIWNPINIFRRRYKADKKDMGVSSWFKKVYDKD